MKRFAILLILTMAAWAQDSAQQAPPATTTTPATTKSTTTTAKKPATGTAQKSSTGTAAKTTSTTHKTGAGTAATAKKPGVSTTAKKPGTAVAKAGATKAADANGPNPEAIFMTSMGKMKCELFPKQAPKTVANFIGLAQGTKEWTDPKTGQKTKKPLFDNTIIHRVIPNFMIQGGDPLGNGTGDPGYRFEDEFSPELRFDRPGRLAMANSGKNTNGSQFFITEVPTPHLNDIHTIFGQCDDASVELVKSIARVATDPRSSRPDLDVALTHVEILGGPKKPVVAKKPTVTKRVIPKKTSSATPPSKG